MWYALFCGETLSFFAPWEEIPINRWSESGVRAPKINNLGFPAKTTRKTQSTNSTAFMYSMNLRVAYYWLFGSEIILPLVPSILKSYINLNSRFLQTPYTVTQGPEQCLPLSQVIENCPLLSMISAHTGDGWCILRPFQTLGEEEFVVCFHQKGAHTFFHRRSIMAVVKYATVYADDEIEHCW